MADKKISALTPSTTPLSGTEVLPIVQSGSTVKVSVADLTAGRAVAATSITAGLGAVGTPAYTFAGDTNTGIYSPTADTIAFVEGGVEAMRIDSSANVGIGTSSPFVKFQIDQNQATYSYFDYYNTTAGGGIVWRQIVRNIANTGNATVEFTKLIGSGFAFNNTDTNAANFTSFGVGASERMRLDASGNVGIGTSSPGYKLQVTSATESGAYITDGTRAISLINSAAAGGAVMGSFTNHPLLITTNNTERMRIDTSGNLLVGTTVSEAFGKISTLSTTSAYPCYAARNTGGAGSYFHYYINAANTATIGSITNSGDVATLYNTTSDVRLKKNIADADSASSLIDALQVRKFDWKANDSHQRYGFVAQELVKVAPEAVHQPEDSEAMMAVDYSKLVPMLVKELQSLRARVAELEGN